jgi:hypothetical protein
MFKKLLFLFLLPTLAKAQSHKNEFNIYREAGFTGNSKSYGLHYSWQPQVSKTLYFGAGLEAILTSAQSKEEVVMHSDKLAAASFRLSYMSDLAGLRLIPFLGAGYVLSQPTGTVLESGLGLAAGKWQLSAAYRWYNTSKEAPAIGNGCFFRLSRLFIKEASQPRF